MRSRSKSWTAAELPPALERGRGRTRVRLELRPHGRDLLLTVGGGDAHAGAVALAVPGDPVVRLAVSPPHKEGPLAEAAALRLADAAGCACAVVAGIHVDDITPAEIATILENVENGVAELATALRERRAG